MHAVKDWLKRQLSNPQVVSLALVLFAVWIIITFFAGTLAPVLVAVVLAYLLEGPVAVLQQRTRLPRWLSVTVVWASFCAGSLAALVLLLPMLSRQATQVVQEVPVIIGNIQAYLMTLPEKYPSMVSPKQIEEVMLSAGDYVAEFRQFVLSNSVVVGVGLLYIAVYVVLVPLLMFFLLKDKSSIQAWFRGFLPDDIGLLRRVWGDVDRQLANYVRGKFVEIIIVWVTAFATFMLLGLNYAMLLSALVGFSVLVPLLFSEAVDLHPVAIIVAVLFFGGIWGFWGVFFAIPLATVVNAIINAWPERLRDTGAPPEPADTHETATA